MRLVDRLLVCVGLIGCMFSTHVVAQSSTPKKTAMQLMGGEKVLSTDNAPLLNPLRRFDEHPWFEISNLRPGRNLRDALEFDYAYEGELPGAIHVVALTNGRRFRFPVTHQALTKRQGTLTCSYSYDDEKSPLGADLEAYVELTDGEPQTRKVTTSRYGISFSTTEEVPVDALHFKVSKSATRGDVKALTFSRELRESEQRIYQNRRKRLGPPPPPPANTVLLPATPTLVPGTPIFAAVEGDWLKAEVLDVRPVGVKISYVVHWPSLGHKSNRMMTGNTHLAVSKETLAKLEKSPDSFKPSVEIAKNELQPPPPDHVVVPDKLKLFPGTPIHMGVSYLYYVLEDTGENIKVAVSYAPLHIDTLHRRTFTIHKDVVKQLSQPGTEKKFADKLAEVQAAAKPTFPSGIPVAAPALPADFPAFPAAFVRPARTYPITMVIPKDYERVTKDTLLEAGTRCMLVWGRNWNNATVKSVRENGDPEIHWEGWSTVEPVTRDSLIISKTVVAQLKAKAAKNAKTTPKATATVASKTGKEKDSDPDKKKGDDAGDGEASKYKLILESAGTKKISVTKVIMEMTGLNLTDAKEVADELPIDLKNDLSKADANKWMKKFEDAGATVKLEAVQAVEPE